MLLPAVLSVLPRLQYVPEVLFLLFPQAAPLFPGSFPAVLFFQPFVPFPAALFCEFPVLFAPFSVFLPGFPVGSFSVPPVLQEYIVSVLSVLFAFVSASAVTIQTESTVLFPHLQVFLRFPIP